MQKYDLAAIFESSNKFQEKVFTNQEKKTLQAYLTAKPVFKNKRMLQLLTADSQGNELTWIEWFNWYYQGVSLSDFPTWLEAAKNELSINDVDFSSYTDLIALGWEVKDVVKSSIDISAQGIGNYIPNDNELDHWVRLRSKNADLFTAVLLAGELVGQFGFIKLTATEYQQMSCGELVEDSIEGLSEITDQDIFLYIPSVVIKPSLQKKSILMNMLKHLFEQLNNSAIRAQVKGVIALAYTPEGAKLCQQFNLTPKPSKIKDQQIYNGTMDALRQSKLFQKVCGKIG